MQVLGGPWVQWQRILSLSRLDFGGGRRKDVMGVDETTGTGQGDLETERQGGSSCFGLAGLGRLRRGRAMLPLPLAKACRL